MKTKYIYDSISQNSIIVIVILNFMGVKVMHLTDRLGFFKFSNFSFEWNGDYNGFV
jgi:hypothetical protein